MTTNLEIKKDSELYAKAKTLLSAAYDYWKEYQKLGESSAVVFLEGDNGHFLLFTRSEYKNAIMSVVGRETSGEPPLEHPFEQ